MRPVARLAASTFLALLVGIASAWAANDPGLTFQWNMPRIGADAAWSAATGQGVTVAVVDSGVHLSHEDLADRLVPGRNFVTPNTPPQDDNGHGTHVAGIAAAIINNGRGIVGVAPSARIMPVKVLDANGEGTYANAAAGIRWAVDNGAHVVNLSLGSTVATLIGSPTVFVDAVHYAFTRGAICVVAAGNDFVLSSDFADEDAVVVSATTKTDTAASYSNGVGRAKWGLAAPGGAANGNEDDDILSTYWPHTERDALNRTYTYGDYVTMAGTSMAAPHVAGAIAVLRSLGLSAEQAVDRLRATAKDLGTRGRDDLYGDGRVDVAKAVSGLASAGSGSGSGGSTTTTVGSAGAAGAAGGRRTSSGGGSTTTASSGAKRSGGPTSTTSSTSTSELHVTAAAPDSMDATADGSDEAASAGAGAEGGAGRDNGGDTVWPAALLALAVLGAAGRATAVVAARARRARV